MTTITMTATTGAVTRPVAGAAVPVLTAARFLGHFLAALVGVTFLGRDLEH
ncbi:hypothetical protein LZG04_08650 [Saccharothrix sp. S26]|uniref:hypothetical protein n=1 Tax=Saccharothrix sp. S26 TaxID=2907215 RepID=UPI001F1A6602|nr:hypothetical protein [Saccharothrix sp. S26]MCE6994872.1 hypothetical protein [Saccharothrix sp. S26]